MKILNRKISIGQLKAMAKQRFGNLVKAVVDIEKGIIALDGELNADCEALLLEHGSKQDDLWGINIYPFMSDGNFIEFDSVINIRPSVGNNSRGVEDVKIRRKIVKVVKQLIKNEVPT